MFTAFHFPEVRTNLLVGQSADIDTLPGVQGRGGGRRARRRSAGPRRRPPEPKRESALTSRDPAAAASMAKAVQRDGEQDEVAVELPLEIA